ncbi:hypothetical protein AAC387_Pa08g2565 [Persea americana]
MVSPVLNMKLLVSVCTGINSANYQYNMPGELPFTGMPKVGMQNLKGNEVILEYSSIVAFATAKFCGDFPLY